MAYDEGLAERVRAIMPPDGRLSERKMFGGLAFMFDGHMACGIVDDKLMLRVGNDRYEELLAKPHVTPMDFTGRPLRGMVYVNPKGIRGEAQLRSYVELALHIAEVTPPVRSTRKRRGTNTPLRAAKAPLPKSSTNVARRPAGRSGRSRAPDAGLAPKERRPTGSGRSRTPDTGFASKEKRRPAGLSGRSRALETAFSGVPKETLTFLRGLEAHNDKAWFEAHRAEYERDYVTVGVALVRALGPRLNALAPGLSYEPRVNGSLFRINRDVRFSKDKTPYKPHLDLWFWAGERKGWQASGFFFRLRPTRLLLGCGIHHFEGEQLTRYRDAILDAKQGRALAQYTVTLDEGPYELPKPIRKNVPRGFAPDHARAGFLKLDGLTVVLETKLPAELHTPRFTDFCLTHYGAFLPLHAWLLRNVART